MTETEYRKMKTADLCRLFKSWLGPEGLARLAELEALARPRKAARSNRCDTKRIRAAIRAAMKGSAKREGYGPLVVILEVASVVERRLAKKEDAGLPKKEPASQLKFF